MFWVHLYPPKYIICLRGKKHISHRSDKSLISKKDKLFCLVGTVVDTERKECLNWGRCI